MGSSLLLLAAGSAVAVADAGSGSATMAGDADATAVAAGSQGALAGSGQSNVEFVSTETEERGDIVEIQLTGLSAEYVTVTLGSSDAGYQSNVTIRDDGDGIVRLRWNSYLADADQSGDGNPWSTTGGDSVVAQNVRTTIADGPEHIITAGNYRVAARDGRIRDGAASDPPDALTDISLTQRSTDSIETFTAPNSLATELTSPADVSSRIGDTVTGAEDIAKNDLLITRIEASGLAGALRAQDEGDATANFYGAVADDVVRLNHTEILGEASNRNADVIPVTALETGESVTVLADYEDGTYYVVYETAGDDRLQPLDAFETQFTVESRHRSLSNFGLVPPNASRSFEDTVLADEFEVVRGTYDIATTPSGTVQVRAESGQTIGGTSSYAPGTTLSVSLRSKDGSSSQFVIGPREVAVDSDGRWASTFDFSSYNVGATFTVSLERGNEEATTADGEIRGPPEVLTLEFDDQSSRGSVAAITAVELNTGGFVVLRRDSASGPIIGHSNYVEENSLTQNLQVVLDQRLTSSTTLVAVPYLDGNNNQEFDPDVDDPYTSGGTPVADSARIRIEGGEPEFVVSDLEQSAAAVQQGSTYDVSATVANDGGSDGSGTVEYRLGGRTVGSQSVSLQSGEARTVTFVGLSADQPPGAYTHGIATADDSVAGQITVEESAESTSYAVEEVSPGETTVSAGEEVTVRAAITNTGDTSGEVEAVLRVDGQRLSTATTSLAGGETGVVTFPQQIATDRLGAGEHVYTVVAGTDSRTNRLTVDGGTTGGTVDSLAISRGSATTEGVTISSAELSTGGFVAVHADSPTGPVVGVSEYLESGREYRDIPIAFSEPVADGTSVVAVAHYDTNGNEAFDYASGSSTDRAYATGSSSVASQQVSAQDGTRSGTPDGTPQSDGTTTPDSDDESGSSDDGIVGGFGPVPLAGAAVVVLGIVGVGAYTVLGGSDDDGPDSPGAPAATEPDTAESPSAAAGDDAASDGADAGQWGSLTDAGTSGAGGGEPVDAAGTEKADTAGVTEADDGQPGSAADAQWDTAAEDTATGEPAADAAAGSPPAEDAEFGPSVDEEPKPEEASEPSAEEASDGYATADSADGESTDWSSIKSDSDGGAAETGDGETSSSTDADGDAADTGSGAASAGPAGAAAGAAGGGGTGAGGAAGGATDPQTALEQGVPSLANVEPVHVGPALATYGASMATANGDLPVEVVTVAPDVALDSGLVDRFETIADQWFTAGTHANVRTVHDWGVDPRPYLTVDGLPTAQPFSQARSSMTLDQTVAVVSDVAAALTEAGFHHDLSLDCIKLVTGQNGYTAVVDGWGLERSVMEFTEGQYLTGYTAPEQLTGDRVDERTDVYGLGAVTYHAMTGQTPVQPDPDAIRQGPGSRASEFVQLSPQADTAIMTALAADPADRHGTPQAYAEALTNAFW